MTAERPSALARLRRQPWRFGFDAAVRVLARAERRSDFTDIARFRSPPALAYPPADVTEVRPDQGKSGLPRVTASVMGLTGPAGVLPRFFSEIVTATLRDRSRALHDFLDMLGHRMVGLFARAGAKYRLHRAAETAMLDSPPSPDPVSRAVLALGGYGTDHLVPRLAAGPEPLLHYAGFYAMRPRSADRLAALASDWLGREVEVVQFAGAWLKLPADQQTRLAVGRRPGAWNRLAVDAAIGTRAWDVQARVILRIGPLDRTAFEALLPDRQGLRRLVSLVRAYLGFETGFAINPVLAADQIPPLFLDAGADPPPRLGWNTWVPAARPGIPPAGRSRRGVRGGGGRGRGSGGKETGSMTGWGAGYITDVAYMPGYYRLQSPGILSLACMLNSVPAIDPQADEPLAYLELGCGFGYTAMVLAACNPAWQVTGIDFNPAHVAAARQLAREAGLANIRFIEADLATLAEDAELAAIPEADVVSLHGLWSWVSAGVKGGVLRLLRAKVRAGGVVHASYNALPAWQSALGLQRTLREGGRRVSARSDQQAQAGLRLVQSLLAAEAGQIKNYGYATALLDSAAKSAAPYLSHEFMNENWNPCFHADVVADFAEAKLDWVGSAALAENFSQLMLTEEQRKLADQFDDPVMAELIKDMCLTRGLRHDVFVRGARRVSTAERNVMLGEVTLALACLPEHFESEAVFQVGKASMEPAFYGPIIAALNDGPRRVRDLITLPEVVGRRDNPAELIGMLVGTDQAVPVTPRPHAEDGASERFNRRIGPRVLRPDLLNARFALASSSLGAALNANGLELMVFLKLQADPEHADPEAWIKEVSASREGVEPDKLRESFARILEARVPVWRRFGILQ